MRPDNRYPSARHRSSLNRRCRAKQSLEGGHWRGSFEARCCLRLAARRIGRAANSSPPPLSCSPWSRRRSRTSCRCRSARASCSGTRGRLRRGSPSCGRRHGRRLAGWPPRPPSGPPRRARRGSSPRRLRLQGRRAGEGEDLRAAAGVGLHLALAAESLPAVICPPCTVRKLVARPRVRPLDTTRWAEGPSPPGCTDLRHAVAVRSRPAGHGRGRCGRGS